MNLRKLKPRGEPDGYIDKPDFDEDSQQSTATLWERFAGLVIHPRREPWANASKLRPSTGNSTSGANDGRDGVDGRDGEDGAAGPAGADGSSALPSGVIVMSHLLSLGAGWQLCDGTNGTPDLRDKFIVAAGNGYAMGATGGAATIYTNAHDTAHKHPLGYNESIVEVQSGTGQNVVGSISWTNSYLLVPETAEPRVDSWDNPLEGAQKQFYHYFSSNPNTFASDNSPDIDHVPPEASASQFDNRPPFHALYFHMKL